MKRTKKRLSKAKSAQLYALNKSPRAGYLHCPNNIKAAACTAQATNRDLQAEVQRLRDVEQSLMGTVDGLQGDLDDLQAAHQRLQGTTPELAVPAGAPPLQQQQLAAASTSRKREAPAANKPRAAKQGLLQGSVQAQGTDQRRGRVVLVDELRTGRASSAWAPASSHSPHAAAQPAASEPGPNTPPSAKCSKGTKAKQADEPSQPTKGKGKARVMASEAKPPLQSGRWLDRDCSAALYMQHTGENLPKLPAKGKEYPELGYKRLWDQPYTAEQRQQQQPVAQQCVPPLELS
ncbi:hypothetical protein QJQ45_011189 [Haematococcus lacustris]|nr:hypothetical protein QJQ45_011190 [Haematococcus lacustris]KAJ9516461.1 hypothetical protein QJQ45_011189 [Haematococcus lacustris]